jgi:hypothetical protein
MDIWTPAEALGASFHPCSQSSRKAVGLICLFRLEVLVDEWLSKKPLGAENALWHPLCLTVCISGPTKEEDGMPASMAVIPALGRLRQKDHEFQASLGYVARLHLKKK